MKKTTKTIQITEETKKIIIDNCEHYNNKVLEIFEIDCYLISPRVYGKTNNISPLVTIMVVSIGGSLFGILGVVISLPIFLLIRETYLFYRKDLKTSMDSLKETIKE